MNDAANDPTVTLTVPATAENLALMRSLVTYHAGRAHFTVDEIEDLKMAVEEAGVQVLRKATGDRLELELVQTDEGLILRVAADTDADPVIDPDSFSSMILAALSDSFAIEHADGRATVVLTKRAQARDDEHGPGGGG